MLIIIVQFINKTATKQDHSSDDFFKPIYAAVELIIQFNGRGSETGMLSPYYDVITAIKRSFGLLDEPIDENFAMRSFMIQSLIDILARHGKRDKRK